MVRSKGITPRTEGDMLSLPFNASTPVLWVNRDAMEAAGVDPDTDLSTWQNVGCCVDRPEGWRRRLPAGHRMAKLDPPRELIGLS